jgi:uncharacterized membrane protein HdeD (DUF308 family)
MAHHPTERFGTPYGRRGPAFEGGVVRLELSPAAVKRARTWLIVSGCLALLAGVAAIVVPAVASVTMTLFVGWLLLVAGAAMGVHAYMRREEVRMGRSILDSALTFLVGLYLVAFPLSGTITLTFLLAVWFFGTGALLLMGAWRIWGLPGAGMMAVNGGLSVLLGVLIVADLPSSAGWAIGLLVGINLILFGARALILASLLKRASTT